MATHNNVPNPHGYAGQVVTKPPEWHGIVVYDVLFNNLSSGLFLVAAAGELADPATFTAVATLAYPIALVLLLTDLVFLVLDLGDPSRFHHMLRVFKPSSPMSFGTWTLTVFSFFLTGIVAIELVVALNWLPGDAGFAWWGRKLLVLGALLPGFGVAAYKGVLFSTTAQPAWKDGRWLGSYFINSSLLLGCAELIALTLAMGDTEATAVLRTALLVALLLNLVAMGLFLLDVRSAVERVYTRPQLTRFVLLAPVGGLLVPLILAVVGGTLSLVVAVVLIVAGALVVRFAIVFFPHLASHAPRQLPATSVAR